MSRTTEEIRADLADLATELRAAEQTARAQGWQARTYYLGRAARELEVALLSMELALKQTQADTAAEAALAERAGVKL